MKINLLEFGCFKLRLALLKFKILPHDSESRKLVFRRAVAGLEFEDSAEGGLSGIHLTGFHGNDPLVVELLNFFCALLELVGIGTGHKGQCYYYSGYQSLHFFLVVVGVVRSGKFPFQPNTLALAKAAIKFAVIRGASPCAIQSTPFDLTKIPGAPVNEARSKLSSD